MVDFHKKLLEQIGKKPVNEWAREHNLPPQTVHGWIKDSRVPRGANLNMLAQATGKSAEWWVGKDELTNAHQELATYHVKKNEPSSNSIYIEHYTDVRAAAGSGQVTPTDQTIIQVAVNASDWRNYVGLNHKHVKIITVYGDSMKPTFAHGDQVLVDTACLAFIDDGVYAIQQGDLLRVKRIKLRLDGSIEVKSDNTQGFSNDIYKADEAAEFKIYGRVLPFKFGKIDL